MNEQVTVYRGAVFTGDGADASCVIVAGERIVFVGEIDAVGSLPHGARVVDVPGVLVPGFVDAHTHVAHTAIGALGAADCRVPAVRSIAEVVSTLRTHADVSDGVVLGYGNLFYDRKLADGRLPTRDDLDLVSTTRPVVLRCGGHVSVLNSVALGAVEAALPEGHTGRATIFRDGSGRATGAVAEIDGALDLPRWSREDRRAAVARVMREEYIANGVTTLGEICESRDALEIVAEVVRDGHADVAVRGYMLVSPDVDADAALSLCAAHADGASPFSLDGIKLFADGGYSSRTAAVSTPYTDTSAEHAYGHLSLERDELAEMLRRAAAKGFATAVHVNGDRAQRLLLEALSDTAGARGRVRAEHAGNFVADWDVLDGLISRGATLVLNPGFLHSYIGDEFPRILGAGALAGRMPVRSLIERGARIAAGADAGLGGEAGQSAPLANIWNLAARRTWSGGSAEVEQAVTVDEALRIVTIGSARALGVAEHVGSLGVGKRADLVELERDPRRVPLDEIPMIRVRRVVREGRLVHGEELS